MTVISRSIINKDILFEDHNIKQDTLCYNFRILSTHIDKFKNLLQKHGAKKGESILIGFSSSIDQMASVFAAIELGLVLTVVDYGRKDNFQQYEYMDPKTEILLPIDYFLVSSSQYTDKFGYFSKKSKKTILTCDEDVDYTENKKVYVDSDSLIMKCTSSGTTGTPKKVTHTHGFFYKLIQRNSNFFDNSVGIFYNLNHGSSFATYFFPCLYSKKVNRVVNFPTGMFHKKYVSQMNLNHLLLPYPKYLNIIPKLKNRKTTYYTLSTIPKFLKSYQNKYQDIISFFGSNETSGPVFINRIKNKDYTENSFFKFDDFYNIYIDNGNLLVEMPDYKTTIDTKDVFKYTNDIYYFEGRQDLNRINGTVIPTQTYHDIVNMYVSGDLVFDYNKQMIYLAIWESVSNKEKLVKKIHKKLKNISHNDHFIQKSQVLDKSEFLTGVKLDLELLREYFRNYIKT